MALARLSLCSLKQVSQAGGRVAPLRAGSQRSHHEVPTQPHARARAGFAPRGRDHLADRGLHLRERLRQARGHRPRRAGDRHVRWLGRLRVGDRPVQERRLFRQGRGLSHAQGLLDRPLGGDQGLHDARMEDGRRLLGRGHVRQHHRDGRAQRLGVRAVRRDVGRADRHAARPDRHEGRRVHQLVDLLAVRAQLGGVQVHDRQHGRPHGRAARVGRGLGVLRGLAAERGRHRRLPRVHARREALHAVRHVRQRRHLVRLGRPPVARQPQPRGAVH